MLVTLNVFGELKAQVYSSGVWGAPTTLTSSIDGNNTAYRGFDVAYERNTGRAMVVYSDNSTIPKYQTWNGTSWSGELSTGITLAGGTVPTFIVLKSKPVASSNELVCAVQNSSTVNRGWIYSDMGWFILGCSKFA